MAGDIEDRLKSQIVELFILLHQRQASYVLVGGIAMLTYVEGRNTNDVNLVLSVETLDMMPEIIVKDCNRDFARGRFGDLTVDLLLTSNPLFRLVADQFTVEHRFLEMNVRTATPQGLILLKLFALPSLYRQGDGQRIGLYENDIFMLCDKVRPAIEPIFEILENHVDADQLRELRNIMTDIQRRIERVDRARRSQ
jgi:hypothetical protein